MELKDATPPTVTLCGKDAIIEALRGEHFEVDEGAVAMDIIDGDVSAGMVTLKDLPQLRD